MAGADSVNSAGRLTAISNLLIVLAGALALGGWVLPAGTGSASSAAVYDGHAIGRPDRLVVPSLKIDAPVSAIEMAPDGTLFPPADVDSVGWWKRSAPAGV